MKKIRAFILLLLAMGMLASSNAFALITRHPELDLAFSLLEKDNIFLRRYNEITGANIEAKFELGMPYMFGGKNAEKIFSAYPAYSKRECWETTRFYRKGALYIQGFDCSGFARWINDELGKEKLASLEHLITMYYKYDRNQIFTHRKNKPMPAYPELKNHLQIGDYLISKPRARHIMMYIGTLSDYGFSAEELPALKDYLDYPLLIHSGPNPQYPGRIQKFINETPEYSKCSTTDGGINVSILGVPLDKAEKQISYSIHDFHYFDMDEGKYMLTIWDLTTSPSFAWFRSFPKSMAQSKK